MQEQCHKYLQLVDELQRLMKQTSSAGINLREHMVEELDWRIATLLTEIQQLEQWIMKEAV